jgi:branched-chain amino acid transport system substrate-binding protein
LVRIAIQGNINVPACSNALRNNDEDTRHRSGGYGAVLTKNKACGGILPQREENKMTLNTLQKRMLIASAVAIVSAAPAMAADCGLNTGQAATGAPIPIGAITTASGAADMANAPHAAEAYFDCVNANGGINGRPIAYTWEDDQTRPDRAAEHATSLVEDGGVYALVGGASIVDCVATAQYYADNGIINLMAAAVAPQCFLAQNVAGLNSGPRYSLVSAVSFAHENLGVNSVVCPQPSIPGADWICDGIETYAALEGMEYSHLTFDQMSADNESLVAQLMATGADATVYIGSPVTIPPFLAAMEALGAGDTMKVLLPSPAYNPFIPEAIGPYWNDRLWVNIEFGPLSSSNAEVDNFNEVMSAADITPDGFAQMGYMAARVAVEAMLTIPADDISRETVTAAIQGVQNFESDMLCRPWAFGDADAPSRLANRAGWMVELTDGAWNVLSDCVDVDPRVIQ